MNSAYLTSPSGVRGIWSINVLNWSSDISMLNLLSMAALNSSCDITSVPRRSILLSTENIMILVWLLRHYRRHSLWSEETSSKHAYMGIHLTVPCLDEYLWNKLSTSLDLYNDNHYAMPCMVKTFIADTVITTMFFTTFISFMTYTIMTIITNEIFMFNENFSGIKVTVYITQCTHWKVPMRERKSCWNIFMSLASTALRVDPAPGLPVLTDLLYLCLLSPSILCGIPSSDRSWNLCRNSYKNIPHYC